MSFQLRVSVAPSLAGFLQAVCLLLLLVAAPFSSAREYSRGVLAEGTRWENPYYVIDSGVEGPVVGRVPMAARGGELPSAVGRPLSDGPVQGCADEPAPVEVGADSGHGVAVSGEDGSGP